MRAYRPLWIGRPVLRPACAGPGHPRVRDLACRRAGGVQVVRQAAPWPVCPAWLGSAVVPAQITPSARLGEAC